MISREVEEAGKLKTVTLIHISQPESDSTTTNQLRCDSAYIHAVGAWKVESLWQLHVCTTTGQWTLLQPHCKLAAGSKVDTMYTYIGAIDLDMLYGHSI